MIEGTTLWELVERRAQASPDDVMAVDEQRRRLTFGAYRDQAMRVAAALHRDHGVGPGTVVTWQLPTWLESMVLAGALARLGAVQNPILHIYRAREVAFCVRQSGASLLVVPSAFGGFDFGAMADDIVADLGGAVAVLRCDRSLPEVDPSTVADLPAPPTDGDGVRWLFYTSGTTADPKGARHTDVTIDAVATGMIERYAITAEDRNALAFPFPHIGGITWLFTSLIAGMSNILFETFVPGTVVRILDEEGVTLAGASTVFHQVYLAAQHEAGGTLFRQVRGFPGGGSPKPPSLHAELLDAFPWSRGVLSGYGLTEAPVVTLAGPDGADEDLGAAEGWAMPGVDLRLVTLDGAAAETGEEGEVRVRAPQLMLGYVDASLDAEAFDDAGYFRTGDLGRLDGRGMLHITGRVKEIIIRKGENVSAKEVEDHLFAHPGVADVAVIGLPDPRSGERVCAVVQPADAAAPPSLADLSAFLTDAGLMRQKHPEQLELVEALPRNPAGKVLKRELQGRYAPGIT